MNVSGDARPLLTAGNLALLRWPVAPVLGRGYRLFDLLGPLGILGIVTAFLIHVVCRTVRLWGVRRAMTR